MKKTILSVLLALCLLCSTAFADDDDVDTSAWNYYTFEGSAVAMKLPNDFEALETENPDIVYFAGNRSVVLEVTALQGYAELSQIVLDQKKLEYIEDVEIETENGIDMVEIEGADDSVFGFFVISPEGTTYRFMFYPIFEEDTGVSGEDVAEAIFETVAASDTIA